MLKHRLIPVLLLQNGFLVRSELFKQHQIIGNPIHEVERFNEWNVDELIYLDITRDGEYDLRRDDQKVKTIAGPLDILDLVSETCFMPLTWGGRIRSVEDMRQRFARGADKITLNQGALENPSLITEAANTFGSQAIVVSIDVIRHEDGSLEVVTEGRSRACGMSPTDWAMKVEDFGAGEILVQNVDRDGTGGGYDLPLIEALASVTNIPLIACSGVATFDDYAKAINAGASAAAAANIWHFKELTDRQGKRAMKRAGIDVRL